MLLSAPPRHANAWTNNNLVDDPVFDNESSMTASQIDAWLNTFPNSCISPNNGFKAPDVTGYSPDSNFLDGRYTYGSAVSAGTVIYHAAQAHNINPQVLLTKLQNEEALVDGNAGCSNLRYTSSVGYACPDSVTYHTYTYNGTNPYSSGAASLYSLNDSSHLVTPLYYLNGTAVNSVTNTCVNSNVKAGFSQQLVHAAWALSIWRHKAEGQTYWAAVTGSWNHCEDNDSCPAAMNIPSSWACYSGLMAQGNYKRCPTDSSTTPYDGYATIDGTTIHIDNGATAALYVYTPHFQSFGKIFSNWFGSSLSNVTFKLGGGSTYFLEWGSYYYGIPSSDVLKAYGLDKITPRILNSFPSGETRGPNLNRTLQFTSDGTFYVADAGKKYSAPNWTVYGAYGYSSDPTVYPDSLSWLLKDGGGLHMIARKPNGAIFLMSGGSKRGFPDAETYGTLSGPNDSGATQVYSQQSLTNLSTEYLDSKADGAPMLLDGKFLGVSGSPAIYLYDGGKKYLFSAGSYAGWGGHTDYVFTQQAIGQIADGGNAPILVSSGSGSKYLVDSGKKKLFSSSTQSSWGLVAGQFITVSDRALARLASGNVSTLLTPGAGVYYVESGQKHGVGSLSDFNSLGFSWSNVDMVSDLTLSLLPKGPNIYAPGSLLRTPNGAVSVIDSGYKNLGVTSGTLFYRFGFSWSSVRNVSYAALNGYTTSNLETLLKNSADGKYYEVDSGVRHYVDASAFGSGEYNMTAWASNIVDPGVINSVKSGAQLTRFIRSNSSPTVFYIENGQRRAISSEATLTSLGGSWSSVVNISDDFMSQIPRGPMI